MEEDKDLKILENVNALFIKGKVLTDISPLQNLIARYKEQEEIINHQSKSLLKYQNSIPKSKVQEKIDSKFKEAKGLYERGVQPQAQFTMKLLRDLEKELL